jgi:hypothetical protein
MSFYPSPVRLPAMRAAVFMVALLGNFLHGAAGAAHAAGVAELGRLLALHPLLKAPPRDPGDVLSREIHLGEDAAFPTLFSIPGFVAAHCGSCHDGEALLDAAAWRAAKALADLRRERAALAPVPLRQVIIQPWADELLRPGQLAHTTFDAIRWFPASILIDEKAYGGATHLHEALHLTQSFVGPANELEAYGLNILRDPRFVFLNYPYFEQVIRTFFVPDFSALLDAFFARATRENLLVPKEVQWFLGEFDADDRDRVARGIEKMRPLLAEASRMNREHPLEAAYLTEQTGVASLLLDIAAARLLPQPTVDVPAQVREKAFSVLAGQFGRNDNTRLGYRIDRRKEALMHLEHGVKLKNEGQRAKLYFHFLNQRFSGEDGEVDLTPADQEDFAEFVKRKLAQVRKLSEFQGLTELEKEAGKRMIEKIQKSLLQATPISGRPLGSHPGEKINP